MSVPRKRKVAAVCGDGHIRLLEQDVPPIGPGAVLVDVRASLVSPGTELSGWRGLSSKRQSPDSAAEPHPFGYSNSGVVLETGERVSKLKPGDRVACIGGGYAMHTDYAVVPHNLCVSLPEAVTFTQGCYGMLAATALHALHRGEPQLGEFVAVVGLGIVGQLTARLYQLAGNYVIGWDMIPFRNEIARKWGIDATVLAGTDDEVAATRAFTGKQGLDAAVIAYGGDGTVAMKSIEDCMKRSPDGHPMGRIVIVGRVDYKFTSTLTNVDIRRASRTGPGYHDEAWESGPDYPPVVMRWTTRTNLDLCLRLIAEKKLDVDILTTHTIPLTRVDEETSAILDDPDMMLGVVFVNSA